MCEIEFLKRLQSKERHPPPFHPDLQQFEVMVFSDVSSFVRMSVAGRDC